MSDADLADVFQRLATLLDAGLAPSRALATVGQERRRGVRQLATALAAGIAAGQTFAEAAAALPHLIPPAHLPLLQAGERSGRLPETLKRLAQGLERAGQLRVRIWTGLLYPLLIFHLAVLALAAVKALLRFTPDGPQVGLNLAAGLEVLAAVLVPVYGTAAASAAIWRGRRRWRGLATALEAVVALLPGFGALRRHLAVARFARTLEGLYAAGIDLRRGAVLAAAAADHQLLCRRLEPLTAALAAGEDLGQAVRAHAVLAPDVTALIVTGVESGHLDTMLLKAAEIEEDRAATAAKVISVLLPLVMVLLVGGVLVYFILLVFSSYLGALNSLLSG